MVSDPLNMFDMAPNADGAAALVLTRRELLPSNGQRPLVKIAGSAASSDTLALHDRKDMLYFDTAQISAGKAMKQAGIVLDQINFFEYHDVFSLYAALQLEAVGFAIKGKGWKLAEDGSNWIERQNPLRHDGRHESTRIRRRSRGRVSSRRSSHPASRSGRSEPDRRSKVRADPVAWRASIHGSQSYPAKIGLNIFVRDPDSV